MYGMYLNCFYMEKSTFSEKLSCQFIKRVLGHLLLSKVEKNKNNNSDLRLERPSKKF